MSSWINSGLAKSAKAFWSGNFHVKWRANCRFDYLSTYNKEFLGLLERAGCVELDFGGESGSPRLQELICKDVTADQMLQSVANLKAWAPTIEPYVSWMSGLPGETDQDLNQTFDLMDKMSKSTPKPSTTAYSSTPRSQAPYPMFCHRVLRRPSRLRNGEASTSSITTPHGTAKNK